MSYTDRLRTAPSAAALNRLLQAAGSRAWLQRSGKLWQPMIDSYVDGFAEDFDRCRSKIAEAFDQALLAGEVTVPEPPRRGRKPLPAGAGKVERIDLRTSSELAAKAQRLADAAGVSRNAWIERLIERAEA